MASVIKYTKKIFGLGLLSIWNTKDEHMCISKSTIKTLQLKKNKHGANRSLTTTEQKTHDLVQNQTECGGLNNVFVNTQPFN